MPSVKVSGELLKLLKGWQKKRELDSVDETVEWIVLVGDNRQRALNKHAKGTAKKKTKNRKKKVSKTRKVQPKAKVNRKSKAKTTAKPKAKRTPKAKSSPAAAPEPMQEAAAS